MKHSILSILILISAAMLFCQNALAPSEGDGSQANPYQIETMENLFWMYCSEEHWDKNYIQIADIDATETSSWFESSGWIPIGVYEGYEEPDNLPFTGQYDGQDHTISGLSIDRPNDDYAGFFGYTLGAAIRNLELIDMNITGDRCVGGLVGILFTGSTMENCRVSGVVSGYDNVGCLVGWVSTSTITGCVAMGETICHNNGGGLAGFCLETTINNSYATGDVFGNWYVGGFIGRMLNSQIAKIYSTGVVMGENSAGGLFGYNSGSSVESSYWDVETSGVDVSSGGEGRTTEEMTYPHGSDTYLDWDFIDVWTADTKYNLNNGYPVLSYTVGIQDEQDFMPPVSGLMLCQNSPNPFNPTTTISFSIPKDDKVELKVYNIKGQLVKTLVNDHLEAGMHKAVWNGDNQSGKNVSSGIYLYRLESGGKSKAQKMLLLK